MTIAELIEANINYRKENWMDAATYNYGEAGDVPQRVWLSPIFNAMWDEMKTWDVNVPYAYTGYCGVTGSHVYSVLLALDKAGVIDLEAIQRDAVSDPRKKALPPERSER